MRLSRIILIIVLGVSLAAPVPDADAAASSKLIKNKVHSSKKTALNPIDVWVRIRSGMKIPGPAAVSTGKPANQERSGLRNDTISSGASAAILKLRKGPGGIPRFSKPMLAGLTKAEDAPVAHRYTGSGVAKHGQHHYTALGRKRLGAKTSSTADTKCTPPPSVKRLKGNVSETDNKIVLLLKRKGQMDFGDAQPELHQRTGRKAVRESTSRVYSNKVLTSLSKPIRAGESAKTAMPCDDSQLAALKLDSRQQMFKENGSEKQNIRGGRRNTQARINERIDKFIAVYTRNPDFLNRVAERAHPYLYHIVEALSQYRLPLELALLPIVESAYQPTAQSPKNAKGLWQFIPSTGIDYNLVQRHDYDERLDIPKSTQAAIRFLTGLNNHFNGDWLLALAAYNSGQATVDNAISHNRAEGLPADFWSLDLPEETQNYVPRLLALSKIVARPAGYGIKLPPIKNEPYFVKVNIDREFDVNYLADKDISTIAKLADLPHDQFRRLNPGYLGSTLSRKRSYIFSMPLANAGQLRQRLASVAQFMAEPVLPLKSVIQKEKPEAYLDFSDPALSWVSESSEAPKFAVPFLSLNVNGEKALMGQTLI
jgi:hypothetical protein